jgi:hypothetical protein
VLCTCRSWERRARDALTARRKYPDVADGTTVQELRRRCDGDAGGLLLRHRVGGRRGSVPARLDQFDGGGLHFTYAHEGYIAARLFSKAFLLNGRRSRRNLRSTLDGAVQELVIGIGTLLSLSHPLNHKACQYVWGQRESSPNGTFRSRSTLEPEPVTITARTSGVACHVNTAPRPVRPSFTSTQ